MRESKTVWQGKCRKNNFLQLHMRQRQIKEDKQISISCNMKLIGRAVLGLGMRGFQINGSEVFLPCFLWYPQNRLIGRWCVQGNILLFTYTSLRCLHLAPDCDTQEVLDTGKLLNFSATPSPLFNIEDGALLSSIIERFACKVLKTVTFT